ncbi:TlpA disulfide reductase family protein [Paenibacillus sp. 453mf]|uniref:TlpA family protein disulfide reductase n=1 Tax=Paenibacillus sp. 453mf TaxID=1761874 RepID=UPI0008E75977|nr:TlpA disulfide reductase family protein [Paenibacillus sp. 453mf]SFS46064.1 Thiol-disulfide isomerase or thioredoxin [Paenibacillus sp. 453mf]
MKRNRYIIVGVLLLFGIAIWQSGGGAGLIQLQSVFQTEEPMPTEVGAKAGMLAPSFQLNGMEEGTYEVGGKREKPLMLNFWASWCEPCKMEAPTLNHISAAYKDELDIYGINVTKYDNEKDAAEFVDTFHVNFPILMDTDGAIYDLYKGMAFPTNVLIDENGVIQEVILGILSEEELENKIKDLLK